MRRRIARSVVVTAVIASATLLLTPIAQAGVEAQASDSSISNDPNDRTVITEVVISPKGTGDVTVAESGCIIRSFKPTRLGVSIEAYSETECYESKPKLYVRTSLWWSRWWGWQELKAASSSSTWDWWHYEDAFWNCDNTGAHDFRTVGRHTVWWRTAPASTGETVNGYPRFDCG